MLARVFLSELPPKIDHMIESGALTIDAVPVGYEARLARLEQIRLERGRLDVEEQYLLAALAGDTPSWLSLEQEREALDKHWVREEVACVLSLPSDVAGIRLTTAVTLVTHLPDTLALVASGEISLWHALAMVEATAQLSEEITAAVQARVLAGAAGQSLGNFRRALNRAVHKLDPASARERRKRGMGQRRVGAASPAGSVGGSIGAGPTVYVAMSTLLSEDDQPVELLGVGPITAAQARAIALQHDASWWNLKLDEHGRMLDMSRTRYRPSAALRRFIETRDQYCRFPHCRRRATTCDADHCQAWAAEHGQTCPGNLHALCKRHHRLKHRAGWSVTMRPDGTTEWTSPTRRRYLVPPAEIPPDQPGPDSTSPASRRPADE